jgi:hypothetical protein
LTSGPVVQPEMLIPQAGRGRIYVRKIMAPRDATSVPGSAVGG